MFSKQKYFFHSCLLLCVLGTGCAKYLDEKPDKQLVVASTLQDLQAVLDNQNIMNLYINNGIGEASADNYYVTYADWSAFSRQEYKNTYVWESELFFDSYPNDWAALYKVAYTCNVVLDKIEQVNHTAQNNDAWNSIAGSAYFYRAQSFFTLTTNFTRGYDATTANTDMGIPLRLNINFNEVSIRSSAQQSYDQVLEDLSRAATLLPVTPLHVMRPSKPAAYALLSRTYLAMGMYSKAGLYADSCLQLYSSLLDYNTINASAAIPFNQFNAEVIFHEIGSHGTLQMSKAKIDSTLYASYAPNDLRKTIFFNNNNNGTYGFKGNYTGISSVLFTGIATDEMFLNKAECLARENKVTESMSALNTLLAKRWKTGTFIPLTASAGGDALQKILAERRKELLMRDLRWMDIKRLNREGANIRPKRNLNGQVYELTADDPRFALPLPAIVIDISGMLQNPR